MRSKSKQPKSYDAEFMAKAVQLALSSSQPIAHTAKNLGVKAATLYRWVSTHKKAFVKNNPKNGTDVYEELASLRKENARLKEERDILKKFATYIARESK